MNDEHTTFYCSKCGGVRVAGPCLVALNVFPDKDGNLRPTVSDEELRSLTAELASTTHFKCYCFDCRLFFADVVDDEGFVEKFPSAVN